MEQLKKVVSSFVQKVKKHEIHMSEFDEASERENRYQSTISSTSTIRPPVIVKLVYFLLSRVRNHLLLRKSLQKLSNVVKFKANIILKNGSRKRSNAWFIRIFILK